MMKTEFAFPSPFQILHIILAIVMVLLVTMLLNEIPIDLELAIVVLVYLLPVGMISARWGMTPGIVSAITSFLLINYFFTEPKTTLRVDKPEDLVALAAFLILTITISQLVGRMKDGLALAQARENETARLYDLSLVLSRLYKESDILDKLARFALESFQAEKVEILLDGDPKSLLVSSGAIEDESDHPVLIMPMQGTQRLLGEVRVWRKDRSFASTEERLLHAFVTQGVLALERAGLASAEARAKILEESDKMKAALLSSVSHELRTPLATIKASVSSLNSDAVPWEAEARHDLLSAIEEETDHLNQLVGNLLNMSRIEAGALKLQRRWNVLADVASAAIKKAKTAAQNHKIKMEISDELPLIFLDDVLMEQVFVNLIDNSCKYSPQGTTIRICAEQRGDMLWTQIGNQSPSVSDHDLEKIFEKFHRVTAADQITGTGLGLSICKGIVEAHRGSIQARNLSSGFAIEFILPINADGQAPKLPNE